MECEQSAILAFYTGAQNAHVGQTWRPREKVSLLTLFQTWESVTTCRFLPSTGFEPCTTILVRENVVAINTSSA